MKHFLSSGRALHAFGVQVGLLWASLRFGATHRASPSLRIPHAMIILTLLLTINCHGQNGYIKRTLAGNDVLVFNTVSDDNDTLILFGSCWDSTYSMMQGLQISKFDTLGNLITEVNLWDSTFHLALGTLSPAMIKTSDGGYAALFGHAFTFTLEFIKFDHDFNIEFREAFEVPNVTNLPFIHETPGGYLIAGNDVIYDDFHTNRVFVKKLNKQGEVQWTKWFQAYAKLTILVSSLKLDENEFVLSGARIPYTSPNNTSLKQAWMCNLDSMGTTNWEWLSDSIDVVPFIAGVQKMPDGGWFGVSNYGWYHNNDPFIVTTWPGVMALNEDRELLWRRAIGPAHRMQHRSSTTTSTPTIDGNYVSAGVLSSDSLDAVAAFMACVSPQGDSLWVRTDTLMTPSGGKYELVLNSITTLSSGSIVAVGTATNPVGKNFGLIIKTDARGCIEPDCHPYISIIDDTHDPEGVYFGISPNPTSGLLRINTGTDASFSAEVYDGTGRILAQKEAMRSGEALDISQVPSGQYFVRLRTQGSATVVHSVIRL